MNKTSIEYLTHTWNPIKMRCTPASRACAENGVTHCWHLSYAKRLAGNPTVPKKHREAYSGGPFVLDQKELEAPLHLRKPARIGVQFMGDLFHKQILYEFQCEIFDVMLSLKQHQFFLLTKRPKEMLYFIHAVEDFPYGPSEWNHIWLGVSIEDQKTADERIPILLQIPAAHRWMSIEPMLSSIDIPPLGDPESHWRNKIDWVVLGGETGPTARPMHPDWVRSVRDQCQPAGIPFFFKSWGEFKEFTYAPTGENEMWNVGRKNSGRLLDGREWNEMPI